MAFVTCGNCGEKVAVTALDEHAAYQCVLIAMSKSAPKDAAEPLPIDEGLVERVARAIDVTRATIERDIPTHQRGQVVADSRALARAAIEVMLGEK
jgi:hypothetical protein